MATQTAAESCAEFLGIPLAAAADQGNTAIAVGQAVSTYLVHAVQTCRVLHFPDRIPLLCLAEAQKPCSVAERDKAPGWGLKRMAHSCGDSRNITPE
jgi:hypothetical protein